MWSQLAIWPGWGLPVSLPLHFSGRRCGTAFSETLTFLLLCCELRGETGLCWLQ